MGIGLSCVEKYGGNRDPSSIMRCKRTRIPAASKLDPPMGPLLEIAERREKGKEKKKKKKKEKGNIFSLPKGRREATGAAGGKVAAAPD